MNQSTGVANSLARENALLGDDLAKAAEGIGQVDRTMRLIVVGREDEVQKTKNKGNERDSDMLKQTTSGALASAAESATSQAGESSDGAIDAIPKGAKLALAKSLANKAHRKSA